MAQSLRQGIAFIRRNPSLVYSLFLVVAISVTVISVSMITIQRFEATSDTVLQRNAADAENILAVFLTEIIDDHDQVQNRIMKLQEVRDEFEKIDILIPSPDEPNAFRKIASTDEHEVGEDYLNSLYNITWNQPRENFFYANLSSSQDERFWSLTKTIRDREGNNVGLISLDLSLRDQDAFIRKAITQSYWFVFIALIIVLLIIANHLRLVRVAVKATHLEEVDRLKDDFISMASHELKSPLTAINGYIDILRDDLDAEENNIKNREGIDHYLNNMESSTHRLSTLVGDILEVSRIEQNRLPMDIHTVDIMETIQQTIEEMMSSVQKKGLVLAYQEQVLPAVDVDIARVKQVLVNLISNAVKYTPTGTVTVQTESDKMFVYITVADTGLGMSAQDIKNLFSKFYRVKTKDTVKIQGTGLGLWISRELARKMNGDLSVESIQGVGSHFTLKLRRAKSDK